MRTGVLEHLHILTVEPGRVVDRLNGNSEHVGRRGIIAAVGSAAVILEFYGDYRHTESIGGRSEGQITVRIDTRPAGEEAGISVVEYVEVDCLTRFVGRAGGDVRRPTVLSIWPAVFVHRHIGPAGEGRLIIDTDDVEADRSVVYATVTVAGGDANAARSQGVPAQGVKIALFMTTAAAAWLVGIMNDLRLRSVVASQGIGNEFIFIIAAVIGGCLLTGGYGSAIGASIGALIFGMVRVGITFAGWDTDWFYAFLGVMLLVAVLVNNFTRKRAEAVTVAAAKTQTDEKEEAS